MTDEASFVKLSVPGDVVRLQRLLERCSDYYELHEGCTTPGDAGEYELTATPETATPGDLHVFAVEDPTGTLHAMAQLLRNCPERGTWWIGMLVVAPELRGRGIGPRLLRHAYGVAAAEGATTIKLLVSTNNPRGQRFWEAAGFRDTEEIRAVTARSGHVEMGRILVRDLPAV